MRCTSCGFENRSDARFCKKCGQPLQAQPAPSAPPTPPGSICSACGATAKPGARFCPRCGKPLAAEPTPPPAQPPLPPSPPPPAHTDTQPSIGPLPQPYGQPPTTPALPKRPSRWPVWVAGGLALLCLGAIVAGGIFAVSKYFGPDETPTPSTILPTQAPPTALPPTETPLPPPPTEAPPTEAPLLPVFDAQVGIASSATELRTGESVTITVTITNTGGVAFGSLRYQLMGWEPFFRPTADPMVIQEIDVPPGESHLVTFRLEAVQAGPAQIHATVMVDSREDTPSTRPFVTEHGVEISVVQ